MFCWNVPALYPHCAQALAGNSTEEEWPLVKGDGGYREAAAGVLVNYATCSRRSEQHTFMAVTTPKCLPPPYDT